MRVSMDNYAAKKQQSSSLSFKKAPELPNRNFFGPADSFVSKVVALHNRLDSNDKIRLFGAINTRLAELRTQLQTPFWQRLRTKASVLAEISQYKRITSSLQQDVIFV